MILAMDPVTIGFDAATALIAALTLFLSRLDAHRRRSREFPNVHLALLRLSDALETWKDDAEQTNAIMVSWARGHIESKERDRGLWLAISHQRTNYLSVMKLLLTQPDDPEPGWKSLVHLLKIYGNELLEVLETGFGNRKEVIAELSEELPRLYSMEAEARESVLLKLDSTWRELDRGLMMLNEYIRTNFPVGDA